MYNSFKSTITPAFLKRTMPFILQLENMSQSLHNQKQTKFFFGQEWAHFICNLDLVHAFVEHVQKLYAEISHIKY